MFFCQSGDSTLRLCYYELINLLQESILFSNPLVDEDIILERKKKKHSNLHTIIGTTIITFHWAPFLLNITNNLHTILNNLYELPLINNLPNIHTTGPDMIILSAGLWDLLYNYKNENETIGNLNNLSTNLFQLFRNKNWNLQPKAWKNSLQKIKQPDEINKNNNNNMAFQN